MRACWARVAVAEPEPLPAGVAQTIFNVTFRAAGSGFTTSRSQLLGVPVAGKGPSPAMNASPNGLKETPPLMGVPLEQAMTN